MTSSVVFCSFSFSVFSLAELSDPTLIIDPITEERASRTLYRIELLRRIREQVLPHPNLSERLKLCQPSPDLPEWWECGRHDRDLLLGASKHGVSRTDYHILNDPSLAFLESHQRFTSQRGSGVYVGGQGEIPKPGLGTSEITAAPLLTPAELASAAAAAKIAINADKEEEGEDKDVKTEKEKSDSDVKMEAEGDPNDIPCTKTETPHQDKENKCEVGEEKDETVVSPENVKKEKQPKEEKEDQEEQKELQNEGEKTSKPADDQDKDVKEKQSLTPVDSIGDQKEMIIELSEHPNPSPKEQQDHKTDEEEREEKENPESPKSPKSADTEKSPEEEDEERMDEDDKSEKSSQAEGKENVITLEKFKWNVCTTDV